MLTTHALDSIAVCETNKMSVDESYINDQVLFGANYGYFESITINT